MPLFLGARLAARAYRSRMSPVPAAAARPPLHVPAGGAAGWAASGHSLRNCAAAGARVVARAWRSRDCCINLYAHSTPYLRG